MEFAENLGMKLGIVLFAAVAGVFALSSVIHQDTKTFCASMALLCTFLAAVSFGRAHYAAKKSDVVLSAVSTFAAAVFTVGFFLAN